MRTFDIAGPQIQHRDLCAVDSAGRRDNREEDRLPSRQELGPEVVAFPSPAIGFCQHGGWPPAADTLCRPVAVSFVAKTIVPSGPHVAPRDPAPTGVIVTGDPPVIATFLNVFPSKNPTHWPSGERKTLRGAPRPAKHRGLELVERTYQQLVVATIDDA